MSKRLTDGVWARVIQILQESMILGVDCSDLLRQVRVVDASNDPNALELCPEYVKQVEAMHEKLLKEAEELRASSKPKLIIDGTN